MTASHSPVHPHAGADTINPLPGSVAENDTLFDECAGSLQPNTGAYGYRVMPPCLHGGASSVPEVYQATCMHLSGQIALNRSSGSNKGAIPLFPNQPKRYNSLKNYGSFTNYMQRVPILHTASLLRSCPGSSTSSTLSRLYLCSRFLTHHTCCRREGFMIPR